MNPVGWAKGVAFTTLSKGKRKLDQRRGDQVLLQLRGLEKAYGGATGPEVLFLVDSMSVYVGKQDTDRRGLCQMLLDEMPPGTTSHIVAGPAYTSELNLAFLGALERCPSRPKVAVVVNHYGSNCKVFTEHPRVGYRVATDMINEAVAKGGKRPRHLRPTPPELIEAYDETIAPTVSGRVRTWGELRMAADSRPTSKAQAKARKACLFDCYWGDHLEPGDPGPQMTQKLSSELGRLGILALGVQLPIDYELTNALCGGPVEASALASAAVSSAAFKAGAPTAVMFESTLDCPSDEFCDPLHMNDKGRQRIAARLAPVLAAMIAGEPEKAQLLADQQVSPPSITST